MEWVITDGIRKPKSDHKSEILRVFSDDNFDDLPSQIWFVSCGVKFRG